MFRSILVITGLLLCYSTSHAQRHKISYEFPPEMSEPIRVEYLKQWEKGKVLYELNCAQCHTTGKGKRAVVPDFTPEQLKGYELRVSNPKHEIDIPETKVTTEELGLIMTFLYYKKKNK